MNKRGNWLKARREELKKLSSDSSHYSVRALAERVGMSAAGLSHLENTDAMPSLDLGFKLARELGRSVDWVLTGDETPSGIPVLGSTSSDTAINMIVNAADRANAREFVNFPIAGNCQLYALRITGNMFAGRYSVDDLLILDANREPVVSEEVALYDRTEGKLMIKMLASFREGKAFLDSVDGTMSRISRSMDDLEFIHPVVGSAKWFTVYKA